MTLGIGDVKPATAKSALSLMWDTKQGESLSMSFDVVTSTNGEDTVDISDHPVEEGADVTDHARSGLSRLSIEAVISASPNPVNDPDAVQVNNGQTVFADQREEQKHKTITLDIPSPPVQFSESGLIQAGIGALKGALFGAPKATVRDSSKTVSNPRTITTIQRDATFSRPRGIYAQLLELKDDHTLLRIVTRDRDYQSMMIERIAAPRAMGDGSNTKFQIDFKEIRTVSSQQVQAPKPLEPRAAAPKPKGSTSPKPDPAPAPSVSVIKQGVYASFYN